MKSLIKTLKQAWHKYRVSRSKRIRSKNQRTWIWCKCGNEMVGDDDGQKNLSLLNQIIRYTQGIKDYLSYRNFNNYIFSLTLIGNELDLNNDLFAYLPNLIYGGDFTLKSIFTIDYYKYKLAWDGIYFEECKGYSLTNKGF